MTIAATQPIIATEPTTIATDIEAQSELAFILAL